MSLRALGWAVALGIVAWLFILGALVPWITEQVQGILQGLPL